LSFQVGASSSNNGDKILIAGFNIATASGDSTNMNSLGTLITGDLATYKTNGSTDILWTTAFSTLQTNTANALNDISQQRAILGAKMNQLAYVTTNLEAQSANEKSARSTIVDTNYSAETASLTKGQILQQAATAMLAQANQMPNVILSLLK
jgi:flagellin